MNLKRKAGKVCQGLNKRNPEELWFCNRMKLPRTKENKKLNFTT